MKNFYTPVIAILIAVMPCYSQANINLNELLGGISALGAEISRTFVTGKQLKPYGLDSFQSIKFCASEEEIDKISARIMDYSEKTSEVEIDRENGKMAYALLCFKESRNTYLYIGYQVKEEDGKKMITVVQMTGKATLDEIKGTFGKRK